MPGRFAAVLMALSVGLAVVAVGVMYAGVRGLRATWLTALTWLLGLPTAAMLALAIVMPTLMITSPTLVLASLPVNEGKTLRIFSPATIANPEDATTIKITHSYGTVLVGSLPAKEGS